MGKKYIIELENQHVQKNTFEWLQLPITVAGEKMTVKTLLRLTPYTEPDMEQVRKEGYEEGYENGFVAGHLKAEKSGQSFYENGYKRGLDDAWEAARKIVLDEWDDGIKYDDFYELFNGKSCKEVLKTYTASEAIEEIRTYEQAQRELEQVQKEKEEKDSVTAEDVMRQYLEEFCKGRRCADESCILHTSDFTCGRGYHFLSKYPVSDEEVRRAYATILQKMEKN